MSRQVYKPAVLVIPSIAEGNGTGHLKRCIRLAGDLAALGIRTSLLLVRTSRKERLFSPEALEPLFQDSSAAGFNILTDASGIDFDLCIFDMRKTPADFFHRFSDRAFCIGIDEGGRMREYFDYLIDILPNLEEIPANINSVKFLNLPEKPAPRPKPVKFSRILISFGGEDRAGLTKTLTAALIEGGIFKPADLTAVRGPMFKDSNIPDGIRVLDSPADLGAMLADYDLVFTMFGLTCFEALYSRVPVILFNPSEYHRALTLRAGIPEIGTGAPEIAVLEHLLDSEQELYPAVEKYSAFSPVNPAEYISGLSPDGRTCRVCGAVRGRIIFRTEKSSFYRCGSCGIVNMISFSPDSVDYGTDYFFEDYKKQYGRTYLEDFDNIKAFGLRRCGLINRRVSGGRLLDTGCGYGPFLAAASESGFEPFGIDISENAAAWVSSELGFRTAACAAEDFRPEMLGVEKFDALTMWYVIEHFGKLPGILSGVNRMLRPGGVFAFSSPNYDGVSRRRSLTGFLGSSPTDHYTVWSPKTARKILSEYGFRTFRICCPVIHPERFFSPGRYKRFRGPVKRIADLLVSIAGRIFLLGDTFEIYAVKKTDNKVNTGEI